MIHPILFHNLRTARRKALASLHRSRSNHFGLLSVLLVAISLPASTFAGAGHEGDGNENPGGKVDGVGETPQVTLSLQTAHARPGEVATVRTGLETNVPVSMIAWSLEFDPSVLQIEGEPTLAPPIEILRRRAESDDQFRFEWFVDNDEGSIQFLLVVDVLGREDRSIPRGILRNAVLLPVRLAEDAELGGYPIVFSAVETAEYESRFEQDGEPVFSAFQVSGEAIDSTDIFAGAETPQTEDGIVLAIVGDVGFFLVGDANLDRSLDLSDSLRILDALFRGAPALLCPATADANADGLVDLSDPVAILNYLFNGSEMESLDIWHDGGSAATADDELECPLELY